VLWVVLGVDCALCALRVVCSVLVFVGYVYLCVCCALFFVCFGLLRRAFVDCALCVACCAAVLRFWRFMVCVVRCVLQSLPFSLSPRPPSPDTSTRGPKVFQTER